MCRTPSCFSQQMGCHRASAAECLRPGAQQPGIHMQDQQCSKASKLRKRSTGGRSAAALACSTQARKSLWATARQNSCKLLTLRDGGQRVTRRFSCRDRNLYSSQLPTLLMRNLSTPCATGSSVRANLVKGDTRMSAVAASWRGPDLRLRVTSSSVLEPYWQ